VLTGLSPGDSTPGNLAAPRFHVGETVIVALTGTADQIPEHSEPIKEDGTLTLPYIGVVRAAGKTPGELQNEIRDLYVPKYYVRLTVTVKSQDRVYYVGGESQTAWPSAYVGETTVTKGIQSAGDFTDFANRRKVWLIRANGKRIKVNCNKAFEDASMDPPVYPGDQNPGAAPFLLMIQLLILTGKKAAGQLIARHFPFSIGRASGNDLSLDDDGVWDQHLRLEFHPQQGIILTAAPNALVTVNSRPVQTALLRNGDVITLGAAKLQFWLATVQQQGLRLCEGFVWALLSLVVLFEAFLIYELIH